VGVGLVFHVFITNGICGQYQYYLVEANSIQLNMAEVQLLTEVNKMGVSQTYCETPKQKVQKQFAGF
jgi:hypothetical protein